MRRVKHDFYANPSAALAALTALREVGLTADAVGSAWLGGLSPAHGDQIPFGIVEIEGFAALALSGWLERAAIAPDGPTTLEQVFDRDTSVQVLDRLRTHLAAGGGVVSVRARNKLDAAAR